ncbi:NRAMP family divalent metal transporter [Acidiphilium cryptum]|uniref:Natural resistance-associated macrophage protein n=1 Tax=Acidiphilium cryptum (strain JF-5) TaxID=349163 RepID=A5FU80_ACICJ|nr:divalent metal cation transporter [Acidiphilium cryptum]ABQ29162.1 natural resistance-associated macrophage protein [Acidiphilium cryptum JF-5]
MSAETDILISPETARITFPEGLEARLRDRLRIQRLRIGKQSLGSRIALGLALVGPGLLVMLGDNDAGGVITYAQTGATYGFSLFIPLMIPLGFIAYLVQEMTVRLGAVTRRGHAEMIWKRYGAFWGAFSLIDLVVANILTLMTEFIGIRVASAIFHIPYLVTIPAAFVFIVSILLFLKYYSWERISLFVAAFNLVFVPLALMSHPDWGAIGRTFTGAGWALPGGLFSAGFLILVSANIGTTIAPWQLFFQQSCVVDKGLLPRDIAASRRDLMLGVIGMVVVATSIIVISGQYLHGLPNAASLDDHSVLVDIGSQLGHGAMVIFALGLLEAGLIASIVITASTAWAIGEALDVPRSVNISPRQSLYFYAPAILGTAIAASVLMLPHVPVGFLNLTVQVIATVFMPAAMLFLLMLLNDRELLGDHVNSPLRNILSVGVMVMLIACNGLYGIATVFPHAL